MDLQPPLNFFSKAGEMLYAHSSGSAAWWAPRCCFGSGCSLSGRVEREKWHFRMCRALPRWGLLPGPLLAPFASRMQLMLQSCPLKPALSSAWSVLFLNAVWPSKLGQSSLAFPLPLACAQLAKEAGLLWEQRHSSVPTLTRHFSLLINLAVASGNPLPLGTLYFYSQLEIGA